jgi:hypothetical protein
VPTQLCRKYLVIVDLRALQAVGIIHVNRLPLGEKIDRGDRRFAVPVAGLFRSAEWQVRLRPSPINSLAPI